MKITVNDFDYIGSNSMESILSTYVQTRTTTLNPSLKVRINDIYVYCPLDVLYADEITVNYVYNHIRKLFHEESNGEIKLEDYIDKENTNE